MSGHATRISGCGWPSSSAATAAERDDIEPTVAGMRVRRHEPVEEQVAEGLVMAVQLAVARDDQHRGAAVRNLAAQPVGDPLAREAVGVGRDRGLEGDRSRQLRVVEDHGDVGPVARVHAVRAAVVEVVRVRLPRSEDGRAHAELGHDPQRREVHGGLGQPHPVSPGARTAPRSRAAPTGSPCAGRAPPPAAGSSGGRTARSRGRPPHRRPAGPTPRTPRARPARSPRGTRSGSGPGSS